MFRVGQKVVCIEPRCGECGPLSIEPDLNDIGTITNIYLSINGELALELAEFPAPGAMCGNFAYEPGWLAESFRPLVERKTDISIFTAMLNPSKVTA